MRIHRRRIIFADLLQSRSVRHVRSRGQALWFLVQSIKNRFISEELYVAYSLNRRDTGTSAGGNYEVFPVQRLAINHDLVR